MIDYEFCSSSEIICPYCKHKDQFVSDALGEDESKDEVCSNCNKEFRVRCVVSIDHECYPKDEGER